LMQYLVIMPPIHASGVKKGVVDEEWGKTWTAEEARAKTLDLKQIKESIGRQPALFDEVIGSCTEEDMRSEIAMFGGPMASRGWMFVSLLLCHFAAYRMQVFLYLKGCGHEGLNTMNLWVGKDGAMPA